MKGDGFPSAIVATLASLSRSAGLTLLGEMSLPFTTFGEIKNAGYEVEVWRQARRYRRLIKIGTIFAIDSSAGLRFRYQGVRHDGMLCERSGVPVSRRRALRVWMLTMRGAGVDVPTEAVRRPAR